MLTGWPLFFFKKKFMSNEKLEISKIWTPNINRIKFNHPSLNKPSHVAFMDKRCIETVDGIFQNIFKALNTKEAKEKIKLKIDPEYTAFENFNYLYGYFTKTLKEL